MVQLIHFKPFETCRGSIPPSNLGVSSSNRQAATAATGSSSSSSSMRVATADLGSSIPKKQNQAMGRKAGRNTLDLVEDLANNGLTLKEMRAWLLKAGWSKSRVSRLLAQFNPKKKSKKSKEDKVDHQPKKEDKEDDKDEGPPREFKRLRRMRPEP